MRESRFPASGCCYHTRMADAITSPASIPAGDAETVPARECAPRHRLFVRVMHWIVALGFLALLLSGVEIVISHPRFYWGETGNVLTPPLFTLPIPASRSSVPTGYGFVLPDQNGWSRSLHFQAAWLLVLAGLYYAVSGLLTNHFREHLVPSREDLRWATFRTSLSKHLRFERPAEEEARSYNALQRIAYLFVIFVLFPMMIWTGLAMSPAVVSAFPFLVDFVGGHQSARTIHFAGTTLLTLFLMVHVVMVWRAGFLLRVRAMVTGRAHSPERQS